MIIAKKEFNKKNKEFLNKIKKGAVFIYPTDTIYGIGCNALNSKAVKKIKWIKNNCAITKEAEKWLKKLPGKYTLILKTKSKLPKEIAPGANTIGVRIPKNWFSSTAKKLNIPIITTSVNISGKKFMTSLSDLAKKIKESVDFIIYEGKKKARPSRIVDLTGKARMIKR